jgi:RES domain-containing protein
MSKFELDAEAHLDHLHALYGNSLQTFEKQLEKYPLLAFREEFANRIYQEIEDRKSPVTRIKGIFYRARIAESSEVVSSRMMDRPPLGKPSEGRFNHSGQSHLYLSNERMTAIKEVAADLGANLVWCQKFQVTAVDEVLDLSFDWDNLSLSASNLVVSLIAYDTLNRRDRNKENWKPDYYLTRYIMDCTKALGYQGIKYNSAKDRSSSNVVLFYPNKIKKKVIGDPSIEIFSSEDE